MINKTKSYLKTNKILVREFSDLEIMLQGYNDGLNNRKKSFPGHKRYMFYFNIGSKQCYENCNI
jgi:hypothetical protein